MKALDLAMKPLRWLGGLGLLGRLNWRMAAILAISATILHIAATFLAPHLAQNSAYTQLTGRLPLNTMVVLPPVAPGAQPLPFLTPDARYAMCRFDTSQGAVAVSAELPEPGWSFTLHSLEGDNFFVSRPQTEAGSRIALILAPSDERFRGLTPEARGSKRAAADALTVVARKGLAVIRAPDRGLAFAQRLEGDLKRATCEAQAF